MCRVMSTSLAIVGSVVTVIGVGLLLWSTIASGRETRAGFVAATDDRKTIRTEMRDGFGEMRDEIGAIRTDIGTILERLPAPAAETAAAETTTPDAAAEAAAAETKALDAAAAEAAAAETKALDAAAAEAAAETKALDAAAERYSTARRIIG